jgi:UDP-3-O-[3-hydroxymyristoyl] glucosamine N-acyltransferase
VGREVVIAGQVGVVDHVDIGDRSIIGPQSGIAKSVPPGEVLSGTPAIPHRLWLKTSSMIRRLPQLSESLRDLEKRVRDLEKKI